MIKLDIKNMGTPVRPRVWGWPTGLTRASRHSMKKLSTHGSWAVVPRNLSSLNIYIYIHTHAYIHIYIYIYACVCTYMAHKT